MVFEVSISGNIYQGKGKVLLNGVGYFLALHGIEQFGYTYEGIDSFNYVTSIPIIRNKENKLVECQISQKYDKTFLLSIENELSGFSFSSFDEDFSLMAFSAKLSRSRMFFLLKDNSCFFSPDLRELLPYSDRKLNFESAYSIIKFGELPEYQTIIDDVFCVPVSSYIEFNKGNLMQIINNGKIEYSEFKLYHKICYSSTGGDVINTSNSIKEVLSCISNYNPYLFISGGVDSTVLNYLYNEVVGEKYPAVFFNFKESEKELEFAKRSVMNTKAEFLQIDITNSNLQEDFISSVEKLIYPVYDNGSALVGYKFNKQFCNSNSDSLSHFIDGTLADKCYGSRNYNKPLVQGRKQMEFYSLFKERIYAFLMLNNKSIGSTGPRDTYLNDENLQDLLWYAGPFANLWFKSSKEYTRNLKEKFYNYLNVLEEENKKEYWPRYTIIKLMINAAKQNTVRAYDMFLPHQVYFPYMFRSILVDQGKYTWAQKSENNIVKAPLKKILEKYIDNSFIYRKKMGLQSQTRSWLLTKEIKPFVIALLEKENGVSQAMLGRNQKKIIYYFKKQDKPTLIVSLVLSLIVLQMWCDLHNIEIQ